MTDDTIDLDAPAILPDDFDVAGRDDPFGLPALPAITKPNGAWPPALNLPALAGCEPQAPRFIVPDWLPAGYATLLAGHGGAGKSFIALCQAVCIAAGVPWCGLPVERRRVLILECEDRTPVLHWRLTRICAHLGIDLATLDGWLHIFEMVGHETILWRPDPNGGSPLTAAYGALADRMQSTAADVLVIDGTADTYAGSENDRAQVKAYVNSLLALIDPDDGAVILIAHVNKPTAAGNSTTEGYSGSTGWHNAARARWYLRSETSADDDGQMQRTGDLTLELQKSNLGRTDQEIGFTWDDDAHIFVGTIPETGMIASLRDNAERNAIVEAMADCAARSAYVPAATTGPRTAYLVLQATGKLPGKLTGGTAARRRFWRRIEELRAMGILREASIRRSDRHYLATLELVTGGNEGVRACGQ